MMWPRNWWERTGVHGNDHWYGKKSVSVLSSKDRLLRYFMFNTIHSIEQLVPTFGQNKSVIYLDYKSVAIGNVKKLERQWLCLCNANTKKYNKLIGAGANTYDRQMIFDDVPYVADVTTIRTCRPTYPQREHFNGHKK